MKNHFNAAAFPPVLTPEREADLFKLFEPMIHNIANKYRRCADLSDLYWAGAGRLQKSVHSYAIGRINPDNFPSYVSLAIKSGINDLIRTSHYNKMVPTLNFASASFGMAQSAEDQYAEAEERHILREKLKAAAQIVNLSEAERATFEAIMQGLETPGLHSERFRIINKIRPILSELKI